MPPGSEKGRPSLYCKRSHRQRAYESRRRAARLALKDGETVVQQKHLDDLHDRLYRLEAALKDADLDLAENRSDSTYRLAFAHLYEAASDLRGTVIEPSLK